MRIKKQLTIGIFIFLFLANSASAQESKKVYVSFTCDVESMGKGNPEKDIWGKVGNEYWGITKIMDILDKHGMKGTFFVNVYESAKFGEKAIKKACLEIVTRNHDLQLHTHPIYAYPAVYTMKNASLDMQKEIIQYGKELIKKWTAKSVIAHRAGSYGANTDTLTACYANNIFIDSSYNYMYLKNTKDFKGNINKAEKLQGIFEIPVTNYYQFYIFGFNKLRILDLEATSLLEFKKILQDAIKNNVRTVVIMSHSFSFSRYKQFERPKIAKKLDNLLYYLKSQKEAMPISFDDYFQLYQKDPSAIEANDYITTTGLWLAYLKSWERLEQGYKNILVAIAPVYPIMLLAIFFIYKAKCKKSKKK